MAPAMQSAELQFAQRLASSEKGVRDRAVRKLRQYLSARTQSDTGAGRGPRRCARRGSLLWVRELMLRAVRRSSSSTLSPGPARRGLFAFFVSFSWIVPAGAGVRERVEAAFQPRRNSGRTRGSRACVNTGMYTSRCGKVQEEVSLDEASSVL